MGRTAGFLTVLVAVSMIVTAGAARAGIPAPSVVDLGPAGQSVTGAPMAAGRIVSLAADPFTPRRYLALSDAALWVSTDAGNTWSRLPGLERFGEHEFT